MEGAVKGDRFREGTAPILFDFCLLHCKYIFFYFNVKPKCGCFQM